jgi:hypothetical protein
MTAAASRSRLGTPAGDSVPWRRLTWVAWRQHRTTLTVSAVLIILLAIFMALTGIVLHRAGNNVNTAGPNSQWPLFDASNTTLQLVLPLIPALAGLFLGAPLTAREFETGTARFTWVQGAGRTRWLASTVAPVVVLLALIAVGLGLEYRWWQPFGRGIGGPDRWIQAGLFGLNPLPFVGWIVLGFSLGVFFGAVIRRTVAAMAATFASYVVLMYEVAANWRPFYLPPLHRAAAQPQFTANGYGYSVYWGPHYGPGPDILSTAFGWPDGRLLNGRQLDHSPAWLSAHHIQIWLTYQPGSRFLVFEYFELGWLVALSAILIWATFVLIRRRAA